MRQGKGSSFTVTRYNLFRFYLIALLCVELNLFTGSSTIGNGILLFAGLCVIVFKVVTTRGKIGHGYAFGADGYASIAILAFYALSVFWSYDKGDTIIQTLVFGVVIFASFLLSNLPSHFVIRVILKVAVWCCILSAVMVAVAPGMAFQPHWSTAFPEVRGIFGHQQRLGLFLNLAFFIGLIAHLNRWPGIFGTGVLKYRWVFFLVIFIGIILSFARLYTIFAIVAFALTLVISRQNIWRYFFIFMVLFGFTLLFVSENSVGQFLNNAAGDEDLTLTGRTLIWAVTASLAGEHPLLGYGYGTFASPVFDWAWGVYRPPHAHNSFLQAYFDGGLIGLLLMLCFVGGHAWRSIRSCRSGTMYSVTVFLFFLTLLASLTGVTYGGKPSVLLGLLILIVFNRPEEYFQSLKMTKVAQ